MRLAFEVVGHPEPAGSKRMVPIRRKQDGAWVSSGMRVIDANPRARAWKTEVAHAAQAAMSLAGFDAVFDGPLGLTAVFTRARPKGHYGTGRNAERLKTSSPTYPCTAPDATKLLRATEDALTGVVWRDDAQVVEQFVTKHYGASEGVQVVVWTIGGGS